MATAFQVSPIKLNTNKNKQLEISPCFISSYITLLQMNRQENYQFQKTFHQHI